MCSVLMLCICGMLKFYYSALLPRGYKIQSRQPCIPDSTKLPAPALLLPCPGVDAARSAGGRSSKSHADGWYVLYSRVRAEGYLCGIHIDAFACTNK